jgi:hypothetical protein
VTILFYNAHWISVPDPVPDCPVVCELTSDRARLGDANAVVFHIPTLREPLPVTKRRGQKWVALSMESDVNYPQLKDPHFMRQFDLTMTYRLDADIRSPYFGPEVVVQLCTPPQEKTAAAPAVYFASNARDRSGRTQYVSALMHYISVDSYGRCLQNRTLENDTGRQTKLDTIARYKFTLAFENSIAQDYVTEKFFDPLIVGSVPVYLGAPNIAELAPADRCFINVADFPGPRELAAYLQRLDRHDALYAEYLAWKDTGLRKEFLQLAAYQEIHPLCRLCMRVRPHAAPVLDKQR